MSEILTSTIDFISRGKTTSENTEIQTQRIEKSIWEATLERERRQSTGDSYISLHSGIYYFKNAETGGIASLFVGILEMKAALEATREFFRKLSERLSEAPPRTIVAVGKTTSEPETLMQEWTEEKNQRRCSLIDKEIDGTISPSEQIELTHLQNAMLAYRHKIAPLPLQDLHKLHQELLRKQL